MQIQMRVVVAVGAAYFIGYSRGMTASENLGTQLAEGLNKVGDGLTDIAVELGVEFKKYKEEKEDFVKSVVNESGLSTEEKVQRMVGRPDLFRSDDQIADALDIPVEDVKIIIGDIELGEDIEGKAATEFLDPDDVDTPENRQHVINELVPGGESPDKPGSDAS